MTCDIQLVLAIAAKALNGRAASSKKRKYDPSCARYDFRCFLLRLGMVGKEFRTARKHLLGALLGDSSFKYGRPVRNEKKDVWTLAELSSVADTVS